MKMFGREITSDMLVSVFTENVQRDFIKLMIKPDIF